MKWVERWRPKIEEDAALEQYAERIIELRKGIEGRVFTLLYAQNETGVSR